MTRNEQHHTKRKTGKIKYLIAALLVVAAFLWVDPMGLFIGYKEPSATQQAAELQKGQSDTANGQQCR